MESIGTCVGAEATGYFLFDFQFSDSPFGGVVVGWYRWVLEKVEDIITAFYQTTFQFVELLAEMVKVFHQQLIEPF